MKRKMSWITTLPAQHRVAAKRVKLHLPTQVWCASWAASGIRPRFAALLLLPA
jgi:hypothetical protein